MFVTVNELRTRRPNVGAEEAQTFALKKWTPPADICDTNLHATDNKNLLCDVDFDLTDFIDWFTDLVGDWLVAGWLIDWFIVFGLIDWVGW